MKKSFLLFFCMLLLANFSYAQPNLKGKKIYVNPGHGSYGFNDRPQSTIPYPFRYSYTDAKGNTSRIPDTTGFFETNTNLWKCLYLGEKLQKYGATVSYSHTKAGPNPYPYIEGTAMDWNGYKADPEFETYNRPLRLLRKDIGNNFSDYDYFISVHSNAQLETDDPMANYPMFLYRGYNGGESNPKNVAKATRVPYNKKSHEMAVAAWRHAYELIEGISSLRHPTIGETPSVDNMLIYGDKDYYTWDEDAKADTISETFNGIEYPGWLGAICHMVPGFVVEGYHHTYGPARHRALNQDYCKMEGLAYFRGILDYFGLKGETVGYILGVIKDNNKLAPNDTDYRYHPGSHDQWMPCNGAVVVLKKNGVEKKRYTVDQNYNGIFAFFDLEPGVYNLESTVGELKFSEQVVVKANETTYSRLYPQATPAICAYDLHVEENANSYTFSFYANSPATAAKIVFYDNSKQKLGEQVISVIKGENEITIPVANIPGIAGQTLSWELDLTGEVIENFSLLHADPTLNIIDGAQIFNAVNTNPLSDKFGYMYAMCRATNSGDNRKYNGIWEFNYEYSKLNNEVYRGGQAFSHPTRIALDNEGYLYMSDWSDGHSGVFIANTADLTQNFTQFFAGTRANNGKFTNGSAATGSSTPGCYIYETQNNTKLYVYDEDVASNGVLVYNIKEGSGATVRQWTTAPSQSYNNFTGHNTSGNANVWATSKGFFVAQTMADPTNSSDVVALQFYNNAGECKFNSSVDPWSTTINACQGAGFAVSKDEKTLILNNGSKQFLVFNITWNGETPTLELAQTYTHNLAAIRQMNWDYAGNLICSGDDGIHIFSVPSAINNTVIPAKGSFVRKASRPTATKRIAAYDLRVTENADTYTFSFYANSDALEAKIIFYDAANPSNVLEEKEINVVTGNNTLSIPSAELPGSNGQALSWAVELLGGDVTAFNLLHSDASLDIHSTSQLFHAVDNNPMSDKFGHIYVLHRGGRKSGGDSNETAASADNGLWEYNYTLTKQNAQVYKGGSPFGHPIRMSIDSEGYLYISDWSNAQSGIYIANTADLTQNFTQFFQGTRNGDGLFTNNSQNIGSSTSGNFIYGKGKDTKLFMVDEDIAGHGVLVYNIGQNDGSIRRTWNSVPSKTINNVGETNGNSSVWATSKGVFVSQHRAYYDKDHASLKFYDLEGNCTYTSNSTDVSGGSNGAGFALSADEKTLIINGGEGEKCLKVFDVTWTNNTPSLSLRATHTHDLGIIRQMSFDYAGNLICSGDNGIHIFAVPTDNNHTVVPARETIECRAALEPVSRRIWAYDLKRKPTLEGYVLSFTSTVATPRAQLVLKNSNGETIKTMLLSNVQQGNNEFLLGYNEVPTTTGDVSWEITLSAGEVAEQATLQELTSDMDEFYYYLAQDVKVNNNPYSDHFGKIYVLETYDGKNNGQSQHSKTQKAGIYVYDQNLNLENYAKGYLPEGVDVKTFTTGHQYRVLHRLAIDPLTNQVAFIQSKTDELWLADPDNLNKRADNILSGKSTYASSMCYSPDGTLYIFGYESTNKTTKAIIYKKQPNSSNLEQLAEIDPWQYENERNSMAADGRGGLWVISQISGTDWGHFFHVNQNGDVDFNISTDGTKLTGKLLKTDMPENMPIIFNRGQLAYDAERNILAIGGDSKVTLYKVTYSLTTPTLEYLTSTSTIGNIDGIAFDYAGDLYVMSATTERFYKFAVPTDNNTCTTPAPESQKLWANPLILDDTKDNTNLLQANISKSRNVYVFRSLVGGMYNTLCLPFDVTLAGSCLEGATVLEYSHSKDLDGDILLYFDAVTDMKAGVPYLVEPQADIDVPMDFIGVQITETDVYPDAEPDDNGISFNGILAPKTLEANNKSILFLVSGNRLAWANTTAEMYGMRGYFSLPEGKYDKLRTRARIVTSESTTTDIQQTTTTSTNAQKLILNGMLYILKDGQLYTVFGTKVK